MHIIYFRFIRSEFLLLILLFLMNKLTMEFIAVVTRISGEGGNSLRIIIIDNTELYSRYSLGALSKVLVEKLTSL